MGEEDVKRYLEAVEKTRRDYATGIDAFFVKYKLKKRDLVPFAGFYIYASRNRNDQDDNVYKMRLRLWCYNLIVGAAVIAIDAYYPQIVAGLEALLK